MTVRFRKRAALPSQRWLAPVAVAVLALSCSLENTGTGSDCPSTRETKCPKGCFDLQTDAANCGACDVRCGRGDVCNAGVCEPRVTGCQPHEVLCDDVCIDPKTNQQFCGAQADCLGQNRGEACPTTRACIDGLCAQCLAPLMYCGSVCVNPSNNTAHCGKCDNACAPGDSCENDQCVSCQPPRMTCGNVCVDTSIDPAHCGACDATCSVTVPHGSGTCAASRCEIECDLGFRDDDGDPVNGCEASDLMLWLRAETIGVADGTTVSTWIDSSDNQRNFQQQTTTRKPTFHASAASGLPAVEFDGTTDVMLSPEFSLFASPTSELTVVVVFLTRRVSSESYLLMHPQPDCMSNFELGYRVGDTGRPDLGIAACSYATFTMNNTTQSAWEIDAVVIRPSSTPPDNLEVYRNGTEERMQDAVVGAWPGSGVGIAPARVLLGARDLGGGALDAFHQGFIAEVLIFSVALDDAERTEVERRLMTKYAIEI